MTSGSCLSLQLSRALDHALSGAPQLLQKSSLDGVLLVQLSPILRFLSIENRIERIGIDLSLSLDLDQEPFFRSSFLFSEQDQLHLFHWTRVELSRMLRSVKACPPSSRRLALRERQALFDHERSSSGPRVSKRL